MKKRPFAALIAALITLSAITASLSSCNSYDPAKTPSDAIETDSKTFVHTQSVETKKQVETRSKPERPVETEGETEIPVETESETEEPVEPEEPIEVKTVADAELYIKKVLSDASIDYSHYEIENEDAQYSSYSAFTVKEAFKPAYSNYSDVFLLRSDTIRIAGDTDLRIGMKIADLERQGWTFSYDETQGDTIAPFSEITGSFAKGSVELESDIYNNGEETIEYTDGVIVRVSFTQYEAGYGHKTYGKSGSAVSFALDNKITDNSSLNDVLQALGAPDSISYFIDPDFKELSTVKVCYRDLGAGLGDSDWATMYLDFIFSSDGSFIVEFSIMG